jgi:hypothetical protein
MSSRTRYLAPLVSLLATVASAHTAAFGPGEQLRYQASFLGIPAGTIQITVGAEFDDHPGVWPIVAFGRSDMGLFFYPIRDKVVVQWDADQAQTLGMEMWADENHKRRRLKILFDHAEGKATVLRQQEGQDAVQNQVPVEAGAADVASALYLLRTRTLTPGMEFQIPLLTPSKQFPLRAVVERRELLRTPLGERVTVRVRLTTQFSGKLEAKRDLVIYFTDDAAHVPVRIEADLALGTVVVELTEFQPGQLIPARPAAAIRQEVR